MNKKVSILQIGKAGLLTTQSEQLPQAPKVLSSLNENCLFIRECTTKVQCLTKAGHACGPVM